MTQSKAQSATTAGRRPGALSRWIIAGMILLWLAALLSRNVIRAHWWAHRLVVAGSAEARLDYFHRLAGLGDVAVPAVDALLENDDPGLRSFAVGVLHHAPGEEAFALLKQASYDPDVDVARLAIQGIGVRGDEDSVKALSSITATADERRAMIAAAALTGIGTDAAVRVLVRLVHEHEDSGVRVEAIYGLEVLRAQEAIGVLIEALQDDAVFEGLTEGGLVTARVFQAVGTELTHQDALPDGAFHQPEDCHVVWHCAVTALRTITGHSFYLATGDAADRTTVAKAWHRWWLETEGRLDKSPP